MSRGSYWWSWPFHWGCKRGEDKRWKLLSRDMDHHHLLYLLLTSLSPSARWGMLPGTKTQGILHGKEIWEWSREKKERMFNYDRALQWSKRILPYIDWSPEPSSIFFSWNDNHWSNLIPWWNTEYSDIMYQISQGLKKKEGKKDIYTHHRLKLLHRRQGKKRETTCIINMRLGSHGEKAGLPLENDTDAAIYPLSVTTNWNKMKGTSTIIREPTIPHNSCM